MRKATIAAMLFALVCWAVPIKVLAQTATQPKTEYQNQNQESFDYTSDDIVIKDNAIQPTYSLNTGKNSQSVGVSASPKVGSSGGRHNADSDIKITPEQLSTFLGSSPLAAHSEKILQSKYWATIIGICWIEENKCQINPHGSNNFYGMMRGGQIIHYPTIDAGIDAIDSFLDKAYTNGRTTIESFRGWYCASECTNWESTVIKTKIQLESLNN